MSKKSFLPGCLVVLGLTAVTAGGVYLYLRGQLPWQRFTPLESAKVIPETAFASKQANRSKIGDGGSFFGSKEI